MSVVVGVDPSLTSTGIFALQHGRPVAIRSIGHYTRNAKSYDDRSDRIVSESFAVTNLILGDITDIYGLPDVVVIEGPAYGNANAFTHDGSGLWWGLYSTLRARRIPIAVVAPKTRALWVTGNGNAGKKEVTETVRSFWPKLHIANHDQADAGALALMAALHLGDPMPFPIKPQHYERMKAVKWPSIPCAKPENTQAGAVQ